MATMMKNERGIAMVAVLLVMLLMSALMVGFTTVIMSDQRFRGIDRDRSQAFYAAHSGLEKMTVDLHNLFFLSVAPSAAQLTTLMSNCPNMNAQGIYFLAAGDVTDPAPYCGSGYRLRVPPGGATSGAVQSGPYQGLIALKTQYNLESTARTRTGGEVHLSRKVETVAIPVFQFGMFSDVDLSFFAGPQFNFGGRIHTNGNLFLSGGATLTLREKVTAVGEVVREQLSNGASIDAAPAHNSNISMARAAGSFRDLLRSEGSVAFGVGSTPNPAWTNISLSTYNGYIRNGRTGARPLNLPVITAGGSNPDLVRRPVTLSAEDTANPTLFGQRFYSQVSLRILLSDNITDLTQLPGVTATPPIDLNTNWEIAANRPAGYVVNAATAERPGLARTNTPVTTAMGIQMDLAENTGSPVTIEIDLLDRPAMLLLSPLLSWPVGFTATTNAANGSIPWAFTCAAFNGVALTACNIPDPPGGGNPVFAADTVISTPYLSTNGTPTIGGYIKIERQAQAGGWTDVTASILSFGLTAHTQSIACLGAADPSPNAIIRLQAVAVVPSQLPAPCTGGTMQRGVDYWPLSLFDPREGLVRDVAPVGITLGGIMYYVQLDARNLSRWFLGTAPYAAGLGPGSKFDNGFSVYFSDRRSNSNAANNETGEYGWEDTVNPAAAAGGPNGTLDLGEDVNASAVVDIYGQNPTFNGALGAPPGAVLPLTAAARPWTLLTSVAEAQANRALLFRRALKLVRGAFGNLVTPGLTIVAENPIYVEGDWNATNAAFPTGVGASATAIIGDTVTLLSNNWDDETSFAAPYNPGARARSAQSYYRFATISGKPPSFPRPTLWASAGDFGTDGGAHNFLRMLESGGTVNYLGSIATFFYSRQATGTFKCCNTVYGAPTRNFNFDTNFLTPSLLPPLTPVFRDVNTLGFSQENRPGR